MKQTKSITTQDFNKLCRFCAKANNELKPIFKNDDCDESLSISNVFKNCFNFDVIPDERLPLLICSACAKKLMNANNFRQQCTSSYEFLIEIYENEESETNSADYDVKEDITVEPTPVSITVEPTPVLVMVKDEEPEHPPVKYELDFVADDKSTANFARMQFDREVIEHNTSSTIKESKYKGRGRPRKGQEVVKQKRIPRPHPLEMCQICGQLFKSIKTHMFVHDTQPQFECHHCGRKFKHKPNLICHVKNHQNIRKFQCPHCPFKFQYSTNFKRHIRTHTGEKIFGCDICEKRFSRSGGLKRHKLTHDVPRVPCTYCEKMFTTTKGLLNHVGIHTGERPFKCKVCGAAFVASSSLCVHSRIHKKENPVIQCNECGLVVTDNVMLMNHMKDHQEISAVK